ncbi:MAG: hypothetical protein ABI988_19440 [Nitrospirota bacterium]
MSNITGYNSSTMACTWPAIYHQTRHPQEMREVWNIGLFAAMSSVQMYRKNQGLFEPASEQWRHILASSIE